MACSADGQGLNFWDYSIGSTAPGKLDHVERKHLERKQILPEPKSVGATLQPAVETKSPRQSTENKDQDAERRVTLGLSSSSEQTL